jgi:hypothetical protein
MHKPRFGRRHAVPSSVQVRHELRQFSAQEDARERCALAVGLPPRASWEAILLRRRELGIEPAAAPSVPPGNQI